MPEKVEVPTPIPFRPAITVRPSKPTRRYLEFAATKVSKTDDGCRLVEGYATLDTPDSVGETVTKEFVLGAKDKYMARGNVREMHQIWAVGKCLEEEIVEEGDVTSWYVKTKIVDPVAIAKVDAGIYTGFSIGMDRIKRDPMDRKRMISGDIVEISLVDRPMHEGANITGIEPSKVYKIYDGDEELEKSEKAAKAKDATHIQSVLFAKSKFSKAEAAKWLKDHDFDGTSVDEKEDTLRYRQQDPGKFKRGSFRTIKLTDGVQAVIGHLKSEGKGEKVMAVKVSKPEMVKAMYHIQQLSALLEGMQSLTGSFTNEQVWEKDENDLPGKLAGICNNIGDILIDMTDMEIKELLEQVEQTQANYAEALSQTAKAAILGKGETEMTEQEIKALVDGLIAGVSESNKAMLAEVMKGNWDFKAHKDAIKKAHADYLDSLEEHNAGRATKEDLMKAHKAYKEALRKANVSDAPDTDEDDDKAKKAKKDADEEKAKKVASLAKTLGLPEDAPLEEIVVKVASMPTGGRSFGAGAATGDPAKSDEGLERILKAGTSKVDVKPTDEQLELREKAATALIMKVHRGEVTTEQINKMASNLESAGLVL